MPLQKADVIIVLGRGIKPDGSLPHIAQLRAEKATELFKKKLAKNIICSGKRWGFQKFVPPNTEAEGLKRIMIECKVPKENILLEEDSLDTIGNAYFTRVNFVDKYKWKKLIIVTSEDHEMRTKYCFKLVYGEGYDIQFVLAKNDMTKEQLKRTLHFERITFWFTKRYFRKINPGDLQAISKMLFRKHVMYNHSKWKKVITFFNKQPYNF